MGPTLEGAGVPAPYNDEGLLWDLAAYNTTFQNSKGFSGVLPGWGSGRLMAANTGTVKSSNSSGAVLYQSSLRDVTTMVDKDGNLKVEFHSTSSGTESTLFAYYLVHSRNREAPDPTAPSTETAVPQSPVTNYKQNGSWVVDHFSPEGAQTVASFWNQSILNSEIGGLLREVGNYLWEDSQEFSVATFWTPSLQKKFQSNRGYSIKKYIPLLVGSGGTTSNITYVTDEDDSGASHIVDYQQTVSAILMIERYENALTTGSFSLRS